MLKNIYKVDIFIMSNKITNRNTQGIDMRYAYAYLTPSRRSFYKSYVKENSNKSCNNITLYVT